MSYRKVINVSTPVRPVTTVSYSATLPAPVVERVTTSVVRKSNVHFDGTLHDIKRRYEDETRHVRENYEADYNNQVVLLQNIEELEALLAAERARADDFENKYNLQVIETEKERTLRINFENECAALRDELRRAEAIIHDQELNIVTLNNDIVNLQAENDALRAEILRISDLFNIKLQELEDGYLLKISGLDAEILALRTALDQQRIDYEGRLKDLDRDWTLKYARLEEVVRDNERVIVDLENEIRRLKDLTVQLKIDFEEDLRRQIALVREEENRRFQLALRDVEAKLHQVEIERENLARKNQALINELNNKERQLQELRLTLESEIARLRSENNDLRHQINALTLTIDNLKSELAARDLTISRLEAEIVNLEREIARLKNIHAQELARLINEHNNERRKWEDAERLLKIRIDELELIIRTLEGDNAKLRADLERLKGNLADNVHKSIFQTFVGYEPTATVVPTVIPSVVVTKSIY